MPITPQAREAASRKRTREKHERWAAEMREAGWRCLTPEQAGEADALLTATEDRALHPDAWQVAKQVAAVTGEDLREMARKIRAEGA